MRICCMIAAVAVTLGALLAGCDVGRSNPTAAATAARAAATAIPTPIRTPTAMAVLAPPTRRPSPTPVGDATARDRPSLDQLSEEAVAQVRGNLERAISSRALPGIEALLARDVVILGDGGGRLQRDQAVTWLRQRAGPGLRLTLFDRHHHVALLVAQVEGWSQVSPIRRGELGFNFHLYDASGRQDDERGSWKIDTISID